MAPATDLKVLCAEAQKEPRSAYVFLGESVGTSVAAHALIDVLVPTANRDFNLEIYDGRTTPMATALDSLRMRGLFPGIKVVWLRETAVFVSAEKRSDLTAALLEAIEDERRDEAAGRLLTLLAMAGWTQERFDSERLGELSAAALKECFGVELEAAQLGALTALQAYCRERGVTISAFRDDSEALLQFVERGVPPQAVLLMTAVAADARKRVFKKLQTLGAVIDLRVERERSGALSREGVADTCRQIASEFGIRIEPAAMELIVARAGSDPAALAMEMEKLCLYVGEAKTIAVADVRAAFRDMAESWIFDFTSALAAGQAATAVPLLRDLLAQGDHPLRLLAMIAREVRLLLSARDCLDGPLAGKWRAGISYATFQGRLQPLLGELGEAAFGKMHPFRIYKYLGDAARMPAAKLRAALVGLAELDAKFKTSRGNPAVLLETYVLDLCRSASQA
ncbi:MAG TPA: DNA polymerase III subunit delta [Candidatus Binatia bacterium]|nr:DNA polymerase III subunit delta [Candidatus Binatia bacterium]